MIDPTPDNPEPAPRSLLGRLLPTSRPARLLISVGALLLVVLLVFDGCSGVEIDEETAIAAARAALEGAEESFVPERTEVRLIRQGFPPQPRWAVVLVIPAPDEGRSAYLRRAAVTVDARTGEVLELDIAGSG